MIDESKQNLVCFRTLGKDQPWSLQTYIEVGGYSSLKKILNKPGCSQMVGTPVKLVGR